MVLNKWFVALVQFGILAIGAVKTMLIDGVEATEVWQLAALLVSSTAVVFLPLLKGGWHAALKVGAALVGAALTAIIPLLDSTFTIDSVFVVFLAVLNAIAVQFGVSARIDGAKAVLQDKNQSNEVATSVDPMASNIAAAQILTAVR